MRGGSGRDCAREKEGSEGGRIFLSHKAVRSGEGAWGRGVRVGRARRGAGTHGGAPEGRRRVRRRWEGEGGRRQRGKGRRAVAEGKSRGGAGRETKSLNWR